VRPLAGAFGQTVNQPKLQRNTTKERHSMERKWFVRWGWIHVPRSVPGLIALLAALAFCVQVFVAVDRHSHSASDTLYGVFPYFACCFLLLNWLACNTSTQPKFQREGGADHEAR
jgi:hypothetical protein